MSDTHLNYATDQLKSLAARFCDGADLVIHLGDWARGSVLEFLELYPLEGVCGNMDDHVIRERLPSRKVIQVGGYRIGMVHDRALGAEIAGGPDGGLLGVDALLFGHTHRPLVKRDNGVLWLNPGSVFLGRGEHAQTLGILHVGESIEGEIVVL